MKISIEDKITIFNMNNIELFNILKEVLDNINNGGKLIPFVLFQHFESIAKYNGRILKLENKFRDFSQYEDRFKGEKKKLFFKGFFDIFPEIENWRDDLKYSTINTLWRYGRNGIYHSGVLEKNIKLDDNIKVPINSHKGYRRYSIRENPLIEINPLLFTKRIISHFHSYISKLEDQSSQYDIYREEFEKWFDELYSEYTIEKNDSGFLLRMNIKVDS